MKSIICGLAAACLLVACAPASPSGAPSIEPSGTAVESPAASPAGSPAGGPIPIVIDTDMGMDDLLAMFILLRDPAVDVRGIAIDGTGLVHCGAGERNLRRILGTLDRLDVPFGCGRETPGPNGREFPEAWRVGTDAMNGVVLEPVVASDDPPDAVSVLSGAINGSPEPVTVVALGTWTNLEDLLAQDAAALDGIAGIHTMAGTIDDPGNVEVAPTSAADQVEWNVGADPDAFRAVLDGIPAEIPIALVGLDATNDVPVPADIVSLLEADHAAAGADIVYETYLRAPYLATPGNFWWDVTAAVALTDPSLVTWEPMTVSVTPDGPAAGRIQRDPAGRPITAAMAADTDRVVEAILAGLRRGEPREGGFTTSGTLGVTWDGTTCEHEDPLPTKAGPTVVEVANTSAMAGGLNIAGIATGHTWQDAITYIQHADLADPALVVPDWIIEVQGGALFAEAGDEASAIATLPAGTVGFVCLAGEWPDLTFVDGGSFVLAE